MGKFDYFLNDKFDAILLLLWFNWWWLILLFDVDVDDDVYGFFDFCINFNLSIKEVFLCTIYGYTGFVLFFFPIFYYDLFKNVNL